MASDISWVMMITIILIIIVNGLIVFGVMAKSIYEII